MSIDLQLKTSDLFCTITHEIQEQFYRRMFPELGNTYIDHLDVVQADIAYGAGHRSSIQILVPVNVYLVSSNDLTDNTIPAGAIKPFTTIALEFLLRIDDMKLTLTCVDIRTDMSNDLMSVLAQNVRSFTAKFSDMDLSSIFNQIGTDPPSRSEIVVVDDIISIRFDSISVAKSHLLQYQNWGVFYEKSILESMVTSFFLKQDQLQYQIDWKPIGTTPRLSGIAWMDLPTPLSGRAQIGIEVSPSIAGDRNSRVLRLTISRGDLQFHDTPFGGWLEGRAENFARPIVEEMWNNATSFGTRIDDRSFFIDRQLPEVHLGHARLAASYLLASPEGMTLGGPVVRSHASWATLQLDIAEFQAPLWVTTCRKSGGRKPSKLPLKLEDAMYSAEVRYEAAGNAFPIILYSSGEILEQYVHQSYLMADSGKIEVSIPGPITMNITDDVCFLLRTCRGVRRINIGRPVVQFDSNGNVEYNQVHFDDCPKLTAEERNSMVWVLGDDNASIPQFVVPMEHPDWNLLISTDHGFGIQLISLSNLDPGELISFRSASHFINVTTDSSGNAIIPAILSYSSNASPAVLMRVNQLRLDGHVDVQSVSFLKGPSFEAGETNRLESDSGGQVSLTTTIGKLSTRHSFDKRGLIKPVPENLRLSDNSKLNPQPIPPDGMDADIQEFSKTIPGLQAIISVPGFEGSPIAIGRMSNGTSILFERNRERSVRVAGTFHGPIEPMSTAGDWSMSATPTRVQMFRLSRTLKDRNKLD